MDLSKQQMREEIKFLQKELGYLIDCQDKQNDIIFKQENTIKNYFLTVLIQSITMILMLIYFFSK
jgi:hypothetical protein